MSILNFKENELFEPFSSSFSLPGDELYKNIENDTILFDLNDTNSPNIIKFDEINSQFFDEKNLNIYPNISNSEIINSSPNTLSEKNNKDILININSTISESNRNQIQEIDLNPIKKQKKMIFQIEKDNKAKGRIKKNSNLRGKHNKFSEDNIIRKVKGRFLEKIRLYINKEYKRHLLRHKRDKKKINDLIQRITPKVSRKIKRNENLKWLKTKLYQVFSEKVSIKCSLYKPDYNKKQITQLFQENKAMDVINILNKPVEEMLNIFCNNIKVEGFDTLNKDLKELEEKLKKEGQENVNEYLEKYEYVSKNMEKIFINKNSRNNLK